MVFCGIHYNFSSLISIYLSLLSFFLLSMAKSLSILLIFSKNQLLVSFILSSVFIIYLFIIFGEED